jgi:hypothetical protein
VGTIHMTEWVKVEEDLLRFIDWLKLGEQRNRPHVSYQMINSPSPLLHKSFDKFREVTPQTKRNRRHSKPLSTSRKQ